MGDNVKRTFEVSATSEKFTREIATHPLPAVLTTPLMLGVYDGTTDLEDFLQQFEHAVKTQHWDSSTACHMFPGQLQAVAREWFAKLPSLSISNYTDLRTKFVQCFQNFKRTELTDLDAHNIKMMSRESLMNIISRFTMECQKIPDLPESQQISAYIMGICQTRHLSLVKSMRRKLPKTYVEAVKMVKDYVRSEEFVDAAVGDHSTMDQSDKDDKGNSKGNKGSEYKGSGSGGNRGYEHFGHKSDHRNSYRPYERYAPKRLSVEEESLIKSLTKMSKEILTTEEVSKDFSPPKPMQPHFTVDESKWCIFHEDKGHDVDDCRELKKVIVERLKLRELDHLKSSRVKVPGTKKFAWQRGKEKAPEKHIHMVQMWHAGHVRNAKVLKEWECAPITFPAFWRVCPTDLPVTITATVGRYKVSRIYVDTGSVVDVLSEHCFLQLPQDVQDKLKPPLHPVVGFTGETTWPLGRVSIDVTLEENKKRRTVALNFVVVRSQSKYNIIMGREALCELGAIVSTVHGMMKFPTSLGVATVFSDRVPIVGQVERPLHQTAPIEQLGSVIINHSFPKKTIQIGHTLSDATKSALCELLANNADVFAWKESDMTGVPRTIAEHCLNANPSMTPVRQKKRGMAPERSIFLRNEVEKLV
ncbi:uncharacterized protein [Rutidosis leptorrhynchoides]|uniref:uncharacterized protein n=1 Tax=Rutidosis leptorrhynchoides TaxID=125765 RepID=UPI003A9A5EE5